MKTTESPLLDEDKPEAEMELCISCLKRNSPGTPFCRHCATPLTSYAATGPFESILAEGDFWRKAVQRTKGRHWIRFAIISLLVLLILTILFGIIIPR
jgi:hypothetical protein